MSNMRARPGSSQGTMFSNSDIPERGHICRLGPWLKKRSGENPQWSSEEKPSHQGKIEADLMETSSRVVASSEQESVKNTKEIYIQDFKESG